MPGPRAPGPARRVIAPDPPHGPEGGDGLPWPGDALPETADWSGAGEGLGGEACGIWLPDGGGSVSGLSPALRTALRDHFGPFALAPAPAAPRLRILLRRAVPGRERFLLFRREPLRIWSQLRGSRIEAASYEWAAWFDLDRLEGELRLCPCEPGVAARAVDNVLRVVTSHVMLRSGGLVLHAAGVVNASRACLFAGPSGAGKSTIAALSTPREVLSDDLVIVLRRPGGWSAATTPFRGTFGQGRSARDEYPVSRVLFPVKDSVDALRPVPAAVAAARVTAQVPFVSPELAGHGMLLDSAASLVKAVSVSYLHFRPHAGFWDLLA